MRVGFVGQRDNPTAVSLVGEIVGHLPEDVEAVVDDTTREAFRRRDRDGGPAPIPGSIAVEELSGCDLAVSVGGDGTFLYAARGAGSTPIMGVNLGEVGFLNAVVPEEAVETVTGEVRHIRETGRARTREMPRLRAETDDWALPPAVNEVVVQGPQRGHGRGIDLEVRVDGSVYTSGHADGTLVATTAGSTAYNLSEGGPLVHPEVTGFVVTEMCVDAGMPPLVVGPDADVTVEAGNADHAVAISDGRVRRKTATPGTIRVSRADAPVRIAGPPLDFFAALDKLG
jgi:NAD+ kinase